MDNVSFQDVDTFWKKAICQIQGQGLPFDEAVRHFETDSKVGCPRCGMSFGPEVIGRSAMCKSSGATLGVHPAIIRLAQGHCPTEGCPGEHLLVVWSLPARKIITRKIRLGEEVPLVGSNGAVFGYWVRKDSADPNRFDFKHLFDNSGDYKQLSNSIKQGRRVANTTTDLGAGVVFEGGVFHMLADVAAPNEMLASNPESIELKAIKEAILRKRMVLLNQNIPLEEYMALHSSDPAVKRQAIQSLSEMASLRTFRSVKSKSL